MIKQMNDVHECVYDQNGLCATCELIQFHINEAAKQDALLLKRIKKLEAENRELRRERVKFPSLDDMVLPEHEVLARAVQFQELERQRDQLIGALEFEQVRANGLADELEELKRKENSNDV